jgi:hypothetical protein
MKARQKRRLAGPTTGCHKNKDPCTEEKQRVRQPAVRYTQKNKQKKNKYIHTQTQTYACWYACLHEERGQIRVRQTDVRYTQKRKQTNKHTCVSVYVCVYEEKERISVTLVTTAAQRCASDLCMCVRARAFALILFR